jgi:hypothetical protein
VRQARFSQLVAKVLARPPHHSARGLGRYDHAERHSDFFEFVRTLLGMVALIALIGARRIARAMRSYLTAHFGTGESSVRRPSEREVHVAVYVVSKEYFPRSAERLLEALVANEMLTSVVIFRLGALPLLNRMALQLFADMIARCERVGTTLLFCELPPLSDPSATLFGLGSRRDCTFPSLEAALQHVRARARQDGRRCIVERLGAGAGEDAPVQSRSVHLKDRPNPGRRSMTKLASVRLRDRPQVLFYRKIQAPPPDR